MPEPSPTDSMACWMPRKTRGETRSLGGCGWPSGILVPAGMASVSWVGDGLFG